MAVRNKWLGLAAIVACLSAVVAGGCGANRNSVSWAAAQAPADALLVASVRSLGELQTSLDGLVGPDVGPVELVKLLDSGLPAGGLDTAGPIVIALTPDPKPVGVVFLLRVKDKSKLAGQTVEDGLIKIEVPRVLPPNWPADAPKPPPREIYMLEMAPWAAISDHVEAIKAFAQAKTRLASVAQQWPPIDAHMIWISVNPSSVGAFAKTALGQGQQAGGPAAPAAAGKIIEWLLDLLKQTESIVAWADVKPEGAAATISVRLAEKSPLLAVAAAGMPIQNYNSGLPAMDRLVLAGWMRLDWSKAVPAAKTILTPLLDILASGADPNARKNIDELWALYDQYVALAAPDVAFAMEAAPPGQGMFRLAELIAVKDPAKYRELMPKMMNASKGLTSAIMGPFGAMSGGAAMKMDFQYKAAAETIEGLPVDVIRMKMEMAPPAGAPPEAAAAMNSAMAAMYGPQGMTIRTAFIGSVDVIAMGDADMMARAIKAARRQAPDLASNPKVAAAIARLPKGACGAAVISVPNYIYMSMNMVSDMMAAQMPEVAKEAKFPPLAAPPPSDLTTMAGRLDGRTLHVQIAVPQSEVRGAIAAGKQGSERMAAYMHHQMQEQQKQLQEREKKAKEAPGAAAGPPKAPAPKK